MLQNVIFENSYVHNSIIGLLYLKPASNNIIPKGGLS